MLLQLPEEDAMVAAAREIARSRLGQSNDYRERDETQANNLVRSWGFHSNQPV
jgi:hypothetical protein